jgi:hypothetical protein
VPRPFGPEITFFGVASADNQVKTPDAVSNDGVPIYERPVPQNFIVVLEGRRGTSNSALANCGVQDGQGSLIVCSNPRTAVQIQANRPLGDGSTAVCDVSEPNIGGVPGIDPPDFGPSQAVTDALNDFACRMDDHPTREGACTFDELGNFDFVSPLSERQFCSAPAVGTEIAFGSGDTRLIAQLRDGAGNIGNQAQIIIRVP